MVLFECKACQRNRAAPCSDTFSSYPPSGLHPFYLSSLPPSLLYLASLFLFVASPFPPFPPFPMPPPKMNPESLGRRRHLAARAVIRDLPAESVNYNKGSVVFWLGPWDGGRMGMGPPPSHPPLLSYFFTGVEVIQT